ncbi:uncharacterized protein LOC113548385 isoform X2 [Rhopalosiphum maidis]|uniref:uncharacterized protein LOC113548385 isoform X2 n=1 Tax=Rhopalosiphum maidis TaxID=43146 RepID=UPI000EFF4546|nr:uncharacterized protein LOC113548385 isoform X2 [Rhopalosiphum maidis]
MQVRHVIGLILLLAAMPLQLYLMKYNQNFRNLVSEIVKNLSSDLLQLSIDVAGYVSLASLSKSFEDNTSENQEVPENLIRNFRPPHLKFSVGNVILTHTMIAGIVVGWNIDKTDLTKEPEYLIITEFHEDLIKIDQDKIIIQLENIKVDSKKIDHYFESFDGIKYIPNKLLQKMYPKD